MKYREIIEIITSNCVDYFEQEFKMEVISKKIYLKDIPSIQLDYLTSIISVKGHLNSLFAFSYDERLINKLFEFFTEEIDIDESERDLYLEESASEIMNIIVGNATKFIEKSDSLLTLTPPIVFKEAKNLINKKDSQYYNSVIATPHGNMNLFLIIQKENSKENDNG